MLDFSSLQSLVREKLRKEQFKDHRGINSVIVTRGSGILLSSLVLFLAFFSCSSGHLSCFHWFWTFGKSWKFELLGVIYLVVLASFYLFDMNI